MPDIIAPATFRQRALDLAEAGWVLSGDGRSISKTYRFQTFAEAMTFMTKVAFDAEAEDHHPEWRNVYNTVDVTLTTHDFGGLSGKDLWLARRMEKVASGCLSM